MLAKYLIDEFLPQSTEATICYFFFKDQDQNTLQQALCAVLHQLFEKHPELIRHALKYFIKDGNRLIQSTERLWNIFLNVAGDESAGDIIVVVDALDECVEADFFDLVRKIDEQFRRNGDGGRLKYILTCRPYAEIISQFYDLAKKFPNIRIPGEDESDVICQEVNLVIKHRINQFAERRSVSPEIKEYLAKRLLGVTHRTYLWAHLVFEYLEERDFKRTEKGLDSTISSLPNTVNEAYERILQKSKDYRAVRKALCLILAAITPLTVTEMNIAINIEDTTNSVHDIDMESDDNFQQRLRSWCGLFISIHHSKVYFIHQTAREFLLSKLAAFADVPASAESWCHSITFEQAHYQMASSSIRYLNLVKTMDDDKDLFLRYSGVHWGVHFHHAHPQLNDSLVPLAQNLYLQTTKRHFWIERHCAYGYLPEPLLEEELNMSCIASYLGHDIIVQIFLELEIDTKYSGGWAPLQSAASAGRGTIVKLILEYDAKANPRDQTYGITPFMWAVDGVRHGVFDEDRELAMKILLVDGIDINERCDEDNHTALHLAVCHHSESMVKFLLDNGADTETSNEEWTPLTLSVHRGELGISKLLLEHGAQPNRHCPDGRTPLSNAADKWNASILSLLLSYGAEADMRDKDSHGRTPLISAAASLDFDNSNSIKLLLDNGADVNGRDAYGQTPLFHAASYGCLANVEVLLARGAKIGIKDKKRRSVLNWALKENPELDGRVVELLLETGASIFRRDAKGRTPLMIAIISGNRDGVESLMKNGAHRKINKKDRMGRTALLYAAKGLRFDFVQLLIDHGAEIDSQDKDGLSTLMFVAGFEGIVSLVIAENLLRYGPKVDLQDRNGRSALWYACLYHNEYVLLTLLEAGANPDLADLFGHTPLFHMLRLDDSKGQSDFLQMLRADNSRGYSENDEESCSADDSTYRPGGNSELIAELLVQFNADINTWSRGSNAAFIEAAGCDYTSLMQLMLDKGVHIDQRDANNRTALIRAAEQGVETAVGMLLEHNANVHLEDSNGLSAISIARNKNHQTIVDMLHGHGVAE